MIITTGLKYQAIRGMYMENTRVDIERLQKEFNDCEKFLAAIGDETRQRLICVMLTLNCSGSRVIDIAEKTNLSRPAVSRHISILKKAGIVKSRKEGTFIYYYLEPSETEIEKMTRLMSDIKTITENLPDRSGEI